MKIDAAKCTGCGTCVPYCPVEAISLKDRESLRQAIRRKRNGVL